MDRTWEAGMSSERRCTPSAPAASATSVRELTSRRVLPIRLSVRNCWMTWAASRARVSSSRALKSFSRSWMYSTPARAASAILVAFVGAVDEKWLARTGNRDLFAKHRGESLGRVGGDGVGHHKDRARRAVVDVQGDSGELVEVAFGIEQEPRRRATKPIDSLRVIADDGQARIHSTQPNEHV